MHWQVCAIQVVVTPESCGCLASLMCLAAGLKSAWKKPLAVQKHEQEQVGVRSRAVFVYQQAAVLTRQAALLTVMQGWPQSGPPLPAVGACLQRQAADWMRRLAQQLQSAQCCRGC